MAVSALLERGTRQPKMGEGLRGFDQFRDISIFAVISRKRNKSVSPTRGSRNHYFSYYIQVLDSVTDCA